MSANLIKDYQKYGVASSEELYLPLKYADNFAEDCSRNNVAIIGIEGFRYVNQKIIPLIDEIADFSSFTASNWSEFMNTCNRAAKQFIENLKEAETIVFNFVLVEQKEWLKNNACTQA